MATLSIVNTTDIAKTRSTVHKLLLAQRCVPNLAARSVAAINIMTESILRLGFSIQLDVGVVLRAERRIVELDCALDLSRKAPPRVDIMQETLALVVNDLKFDVHETYMNISLRLW